MSGWKPGDCVVYAENGRNVWHILLLKRIESPEERRWYTHGLAVRSEHRGKGHYHYSQYDHEARFVRRLTEEEREAFLKELMPHIMRQ